FLGPDARNQSTLLNFVDDLALTAGSHQLKFGADYRTVFLDENPFRHQLEFTSSSVQSFSSTGTASLLAGTALQAKSRAQAFSLYGQDSWNVNPRLMLLYGLRWELSPAPAARSGTVLAAWDNVETPSEISLAAAGAPLWSTTYSNFAPRIGLAYSLTGKNDLVLRAGWGIFFDLGLGISAVILKTF